MSVTLGEVYGKNKEKYFKTNYKPAGMLLNVNAVLYLKFK